MLLFREVTFVIIENDRSLIFSKEGHCSLLLSLHSFKRNMECSGNLLVLLAFHIHQKNFPASIRQRINCLKKLAIDFFTKEALFLLFHPKRSGMTIKHLLKIVAFHILMFQIIQGSISDRVIQINPE